MSLLQGLQKTIPILYLTPDEPSEHSNHLDESHQSSSLPPNVISGFHRGSVVSPGSQVTPLEAPVVPLFEHFLVIGVSIEVYPI